MVIAFYKQAIIAQQLTNCLTEIFIDQAVEVARELDQILKNTGEVVRPLHGLPVSLKDQFTMRGLETIMGYAAWIGERAESDCVLVETLYQLGAVPFTRTNVPQTLMVRLMKLSSEAQRLSILVPRGERPLAMSFGRTTNPYNRCCTPGDSSGGQ